MTDEEKLIRLLRVRTDVGQLGLRRTLAGVYMADFNVYGHKGTFFASDRLDPVSALIDVLEMPGLPLSEVERIAAAQTPRFDIANTPPALVLRESRYGSPMARRAALEINTAKDSRRFVHDIKPKPVVQPAARRSDLEDII